MNFNIERLENQNQSSLTGAAIAAGGLLAGGIVGYLNNN